MRFLPGKINPSDKIIPHKLSLKIIPGNVDHTDGNIRCKHCQIKLTN